MLLRLALLVLFGLGLSACSPMGSVTPDIIGPADGKLVVAGASGRSGLYLMQKLSQSGVRTVGMTTSIERARDKAKSSNYAWVEVDVRRPETLKSAFNGVDFVICAIGAGRNNVPGINPETIDFGGVKNLVDASLAHGVRHFVLVSSAGATIKDPEHFFNRLSGNALIWKFKGEEYLRQSGLNYTIIRPGNLVGDGSGGYEPGSRVLIFDQGDKIFGRPDGVIHRADLADIAIASLMNPAAFSKTFELFASANGPTEQSQKTALEQLEPDSIQ